MHMDGDICQRSSAVWKFIPSEKSAAGINVKTGCFNCEGKKNGDVSCYLFNSFKTVLFPTVLAFEHSNALATES